MKKLARTLICFGVFPAIACAQDNFNQDTFDQGQFDSSPQQQFEDPSINENYLPDNASEMEEYDSDFETYDYYPENSPETFEPYQDSYEPFDSEYDSGFDPGQDEGFAPGTEDYDYYDYNGQEPLMDPVDPLGPTDDF